MIDTSLLPYAIAVLVVAALAAALAVGAIVFVVVETVTARRRRPAAELPPAVPAPTISRTAA